MAKRKLNIELLQKVRDRIIEVPQAYNQSTYFEKTDESPCGTAACIAGETIIMSQPDLKSGIKKLIKLHDADSVCNAATRLLGLTGDEALMLFRADPANRSSSCGPNCKICGTWPRPFASRYGKATTARGRASAAAAYLDHIIETGRILD